MSRGTRRLQRWPRQRDPGDLGVTPRTGLGRMTWPQGSSVGTLVIDAGGSVNGTFDTAVSVDPSQQMVTGHVTSQVGCGSDVHALLRHRLRPSIRRFRYVTKMRSRPVSFRDRAHAGAFVAFDPAATVSSSGNLVRQRRQAWPISPPKAPHGTWSPYAAARAQPERRARTYQVNGGSHPNLSTFYTALYHTFLHPNLFSDADGEYLGFDDKVHRVASGHATITTCRLG